MAKEKWIKNKICEIWLHEWPKVLPYLAIKTWKKEDHKEEKLKNEQVLICAKIL